jgi:Kelch motif protein
MIRHPFTRQAIVGLAIASFFAACEGVGPLIYPAGVEPRNSDQAQSLQSEPDMAAILPAAGDVLVAGGVGSSHTSLNTAEFYDPTTLKFSSTGKMASTRAGFGAISFSGGALDDKVIVAGGATGKAKIAGHS